MVIDIFTAKLGAAKSIGTDDIVIPPPPPPKVGVFTFVVDDELKTLTTSALDIGPGRTERYDDGTLIDFSRISYFYNSDDGCTELVRLEDPLGKCGFIGSARLNSIKHVADGAFTATGIDFLELANAETIGTKAFSTSHDNIHLPSCTADGVSDNAFEDCYVTYLHVRSMTGAEVVENADRWSLILFED